MERTSSTTLHGDRRPRASRRVPEWPGGWCSSRSSEEEPGGTLPAPLFEFAGWQVCVELHVMEVCPFVQSLDLPVPQTVDNVTDALRILDRPMAEQVLEVPKISCSPCPSRSLVPEPLSAEQLGGSADRVVSHPHRLADRRHSSSAWSW